MYLTALTHVTLQDKITIWQFHLKYRLTIIPKKLNEFTRSISLPFTLNVNIYHIFVFFIVIDTLLLYNLSNV